MLHSLLVPLDGSRFGEQALPLALRIAHLAIARLQIAHVHVPITPVAGDVPLSYDPQIDGKLQEAEQAYLNQVVQRINAESPVTVGADLLDGPIEAALSKHVSKTNTDLIVMTTHGRGFLARAWLGSVTDELVRSLAVPMLLVHPGKDDADFSNQPIVRHILIPLDGSTLAEQIIEPAVAVGTLFGADYTLVRVISPAVMGNYDPETGFGGRLDQAILDQLAGLHEHERTDAANYLAKVAERLRARSLSVVTRVLIHERPAKAIFEEIANQRIDLVAMKTHGRGGLSRLLLGSVADKVLRGATVPVLLQRPAAP